MYSSTAGIQAIIDSVATDDPMMREQLKRFFRGCVSKPAAFFELAAKVAKEVGEHVEAGTLASAAGKTYYSDGVHLVATDGSDDVVMMHRGLAMQRILEGSHRLALKEDVERWQLAKARRKLESAGEPR